MGLKRFDQALEATGIIVILRLDNLLRIHKIINALQKAGILLIEITLTMPGALELLHDLREISEFKELIFGAGTVCDAISARLAILNGAEFIVSPIHDEAIVKMCKSYGVPVCSGCLTPTEIFNATKQGSDFVKTFPGRICTPEYYADMLGPFPNIKMFPTGNVNLSTAPEYIKKGAVAVGIGKAILRTDLLEKENYEEITTIAMSFVNIVKNAMSERRNARNI